MTGSINDIIASTATGAKSPQEVLESLTRVGLDCYVTEAGDLAIKYWQIVKDFISPEQAAIIRTTQKPQEQTEEIEWLSKNLENIRLDYAGQWIAIYENRIVATATGLPDLMNQTSQFDKPFITFISADEIVWNFAYAS